MGIKECPHCKSNTGYRVLDILRYDLMLDFEGNELGSSEGHSINTPKTARCMECGKRIKLSDLE